MSLEDPLFSRSIVASYLASAVAMGDSEAYDDYYKHVMEMTRGEYSAMMDRMMDSEWMNTCSECGRPYDEWVVKHGAADDS